MRILLPVFITLATFAGSPANAQESLLEYVLESCAADLENYCDQVTPGDGRLLYCVAAHQDKISGQCDYALYKAASTLQELSEAIYYIASECADEIADHCANVAAGEGRILACLGAKDSELGDDCRQSLADTVGE